MDGEQRDEPGNGYRAAIDPPLLMLEAPKPPARRLSRSTMSLKITSEPDLTLPKPPKPPVFQFFPSSPTPASLQVPMTPVNTDPTIPSGFSPQLYQAYTSNKATEFFFKQLDGFKDIMSTAKTRLSFGERAVFWLYDKIREWSRMWLTHVFLLFIAAGYCAAGALIFQAVEGSWSPDNTNKIFKEREQLIANITRLMNRTMNRSDSIFLETRSLLVKYESFIAANQDKNNSKPEWNYLNSVFYCGTVFTTIGKCEQS